MEESKLFKDFVPEQTENEEMLLKIKKEESEDMYEEEFNDTAILEAKTELEYEDEAVFETKIKIRHEELQNQRSIYESEEIIIKDTEGQHSDNRSLKKSEKQLELIPCYMCTKQYKSSYALRKHMKNAHIKNNCSLVNKEFNCEKCTFQTTSEKVYFEHMKKHDFKTCKFCPFSTVLSQNLDSHILSEHNKENQDQKENKDKYDSKYYKCTSCNYKNLRLDHLNIHMRIHNKIKALKCIFCPIRFNRKVQIDGHIITKHWDLLNTSNRSFITHKIRYCPHCSYKTVVTTNLKTHLKHHHSS